VQQEHSGHSFGKLSLRDYQLECVQECLRTLGSGEATRIGVSSPTGSGKTTMFSALLSVLPERQARTGLGGLTDEFKEANQVLVIVSSIALATQTARAISAAHPHLHVELEQGTAFHSTGLADVTVATAQTLSRSPARLEKFDPSKFKAVIVDEAHHAAAPSYVTILSHFDPQVDVPLSERTAAGAPQSSGIPIIGFSATFARHDGIALGKVFQRIVYHKDFLEMVNDKWLSPVRFTSVRTSIDLASVPTSALSHDFRTSALADLMNTAALNQVIVRTWLHRATPGSQAQSSSALAMQAGTSTVARKARRSTLVFAVNVAHVMDLTQAFRDAGVDARYVHGGQRPGFREQVIRDFEKGLFPVLVNCAVLTEGADIPPIDCLILARPTRSRNLFMQMLGRGLRLSPSSGKEDCLVLDVVGATERGVMCTPTLFGLDVADVIEDEGMDDLRQRALERAEQRALDEAAAGEQDDGDDSPTLGADGVPLPRKVTYVDYESPEALQAAMLGRPSLMQGPFLQDGADSILPGAEPYVPIEKLSWNAWVDCGGGTFVLEIPPQEGYVKIRKVHDEGAILDEEGRSNDEVQAEATVAPPEAAQSGSSEAANWIAHFYPRQPSAEELDGPGRAGAFRFRRMAGNTYIMRPRLVLEAATLDAAIRGADTYVERNVLRGAITRVALCRRRAEWRLKEASKPQKDLVRKRLGYVKMGSSPAQRVKAAGAGADSASSNSERSREPVTPEKDPLATLTKGQASDILTRLTHGAKARWVSAAKAHNRELKSAERTQRKAEAEAEKEEKRVRKLVERERESERRRAGVVQVGPLL